MKQFALKITLLSVLLLFNVNLKSQGPPQPPEEGHGTTTNQSPTQGGSAPIGSGLMLMLGMGGAYTLIKVKRKK